jgi:hypothetical protein
MNRQGSNSIWISIVTIHYIGELSHQVYFQFIFTGNGYSNPWFPFYILKIMLNDWILLLFELYYKVVQKVFRLTLHNNN